MPAVSHARSIVGTIASRWARLATSGTTPPNRACSSTLLATASASRVWPRTMPTPVSSHDVSMPRTSGSLMEALCPAGWQPGGAGPGVGLLRLESVAPGAQAHPQDDGRRAVTVVAVAPADLAEARGRVERQVA